MPGEVGAAQNRALAFLTSWRPSGSYQTVLEPALILSALASQTDERAVRLRQRLADWLMKQKSPRWSFNYWATGVPRRQTLARPDDLQNTACTLIGLYRHDQSLVSAEVLAHIVKLLIATESQPGGPYGTWLASPDSPPTKLDIDLAVNSQVAWLLGLVGSRLPQLDNYLEQAITSSQLKSAYYPSWPGPAYFLARAYQGPARAKLAKLILERQTDQGWGSPLNTALAVSSLKHLDSKADLNQAIDWLIGQQQADGSWPAEAVWLDSTSAVEGRHGCSAALTTALVLEALSFYDRRSKPKDKVVGTKQPSSKRDQAYAAVLQLAEKQLKELDPLLRRLTISALDRLRHGDRNQEIALLPFLAADSLVGGHKLEGDFLANLGLANLFGWTAYTLYDDFLDDEGDPQLIPVASFCLRYCCNGLLSALPDDVDYRQLVVDAFNTIDGANAWEVSHCRAAVEAGQIILTKLPNYGQVQRLAQRSLGHCLTVMAVMAAGGHNLTGNPARQMMQAFRHYLVARQLNDDLLDWETDLQHGQLSYVVTTILKELELTSGQHSLDKLLPAMQQQFWRHSLAAVAQTTLDQANLARRAARRSQLLKDGNFLEELIAQLEAAINRTLQGQAEAKKFLAAYAS